MNAFLTSGKSPPIGRSIVLAEPCPTCQFNFPVMPETTNSTAVFRAYTWPWSDQRDRS
jgi:hypothetical protein